MTNPVSHYFLCMKVMPPSLSPNGFMYAGRSFVGQFSSPSLFTGQPEEKTLFFVFKYRNVLLRTSCAGTVDNGGIADGADAVDDEIHLLPRCQIPGAPVAESCRQGGAKDPVRRLVQAYLYQMGFPGFHPVFLFASGNQQVLFKAPVHEDAKGRRIPDLQPHDIPHHPGEETLS